MQSSVRRHPTHVGDSNYRTASRSASVKLGKRGTVGKPAPSWIPTLRRESTYDPRPTKSVRQQMPETFRNLAPEQGSRIFVSGLPKDITNQDLEDLMTSQIGPIREVYIIHQYTGHPLYRSSNNTFSGLERDPRAETAENIHYLSSTGCGMVHFQREKDALEAWEQYNGKLIDGESRVLRVQIVVDADESWLTPVESRLDATATDERDMRMEVETTDTSTQPRTGKLISAPTPSQPGGPIQRQDPPLRAGPTAKRDGVRLLSNPPPLLNRIGAATSLDEIINGTPRGSVAFGGHLISLSGPPSTPAITTTLMPTPSRRWVKKGPKRLAKLEARKQQLQEGAAAITAPVAPTSFYTVQSSGLTNGTSHAPSGRSTVVDLDAEMEEYRRRGLMGLSTPGGR